MSEIQASQLTCLWWWWFWYKHYFFIKIWVDTENHLGLMWHYSLCSHTIIGNFNMPFCTPFSPRTFALLTLLRDQNGVQKSHPVVRKEDQIPLLLDITSHKKGTTDIVTKFGSKNVCLPSAHSICRPFFTSMTSQRDHELQLTRYYN